jgi:nitrite reductase (NADH) large subunit
MMNMTQYFGHRDAGKLELASEGWYTENNIEIFIGDRVSGIDRERKVVHSVEGREIKFDKLVLATGSFAFIPSFPGDLQRSPYHPFHTRTSSIN